MTPSTSARPTPTGNATAMPAMSMAATSRMFDKLKMIPPKNAEPSQRPSACARSAKNPRPPLPELPKVNANNKENRNTPMA